MSKKINKKKKMRYQRVVLLPVLCNFYEPRTKQHFFSNEKQYRDSNIITNLKEFFTVIFLSKKNKKSGIEKKTTKKTRTLTFSCA